MYTYINTDHRIIVVTSSSSGDNSKNNEIYEMRFHIDRFSKSKKCDLLYFLLLVFKIHKKKKKSFI